MEPWQVELSPQINSSDLLQDKCTDKYTQEYLSENMGNIFVVVAARHWLNDNLLIVGWTEHQFAHDIPCLG